MNLPESHFSNPHRHLLTIYNKYANIFGYSVMGGVLSFDFALSKLKEDELENKTEGRKRKVRF